MGVAVHLRGGHRRRDPARAELAQALHLSAGTARNHLSTIIRKVGASTRAEAIRIAEERGWL